MVTTTLNRGATVVTRTNVAAPRKQAVTNRDLAEKFADKVKDYSASQLAKAANRTKQAAKGWLDGSRAPDSASLLNMARSLQCVQELMFEESGVDRAFASGSNDGVVKALARAASGDGPQAQLAQRLLREWMLATNGGDW